MLQAMATVTYFAADLNAARRWYSDLLGVGPYFERPGYVEFRVGDFEQELGLIDSRYAPAEAAPASGGPILYWHVDDVFTVMERLLALGGELHQGLTDRGGGFVTASVTDPFGNVLAIMNNPHYLEILNSRSGP